MPGLEIIGFFIALMVLLYVQTKKKFGQQIEEKHSPSFHEEKIDPLTHLLTVLEKTQAIEKKQHPPLTKPKKQQPMMTVLKATEKAPAYDDTCEERHPSNRPSRAKEIIQKLPHLQNIVILQEIIGKPKALRNDDRP